MDQHRNNSPTRYKIKLKWDNIVYTEQQGEITSRSGIGMWPRKFHLLDTLSWEC